jgi:hypothetical protein
VVIDDYSDDFGTVFYPPQMDFRKAGSYLEFNSIKMQRKWESGGFLFKRGANPNIRNKQSDSDLWKK